VDLADVAAAAVADAADRAANRCASDRPRDTTRLLGLRGVELACVAFDGKTQKPDAYLDTSSISGKSPCCCRI
jgi:hypothetical protein